MGGPGRRGDAAGLGVPGRGALFANVRLLKAMEAQVAAVCEALTGPDMRDRLDWLVHEQQERSLWLEKALLTSWIDLVNNYQDRAAKN